MEKDVLINAINCIIGNTFNVLKKVYSIQKEGQESQFGDFKQSGSRLVFPHYSTIYRGGETRISEQELRFVFVEQFNKYCEENSIKWYYSVETPTEHKYSFTDKNNPQQDENGQSAMVDLAIHDENFKRIALIEFKALNPEEFCYKKDFCKLSGEGNNDKSLSTFFVQILKSSNKDTEKSIRKKISSKSEDTLFRCFVLDNGKEL